MSIKQLPINDFRYGLIDSIDQDSTPRGSASRSLNWVTSGTKIELRRGYKLLGQTEIEGTGRITGLGVARKPDGSDIIYRTRKRKVEYLDTAIDDWVEVGSNVLPAAVIADDPLGEDISFEGYENPTGPQMWLNSFNAGPHKIMTANPGSITDMYLLGSNYKGNMRIKSGCQFVWDRNGSPRNRTSLFRSKLDVKGSANYTQITSEAIAGSGTNRTGTLAFKAGGSRRICFEVTFERDTSAEVFTDNGDGTLTSNAGGTGTINYTTGAYNITFAASATTVTATYRWADDSVGGIADFNFSSTRLATEGLILAQAGKGAFQNLASLNGVEYCLHTRGAWAITTSADDLDITNLIFREKVGIPNKNAMVETGDGIYYIDDTDETDPQFRLLTLDNISTQVIPKSISRQLKIADVKVGLNLRDYRFDKGACIEFGELVLFACRTADSETNNRVFVYNKTNGAHDVNDYFVSVFAQYNGNLVAGDSVTDNVYILFSGLDDNDSSIDNYWESSLDNLGYKGMKRIVELTIDGEVGPDQAIKFSMSADRGPFVEVRSKQDATDNKHAVEGDGPYVDKNQRVTVGSLTLGRGELGGGGDGINAYHYRRSFRITLDKCEFVKFRVEATRIGYASLAEFTFRDIRIKWQKIARKYLADR